MSVPIHNTAMVVLRPREAGASTKPRQALRPPQSNFTALPTQAHCITFSATNIARKCPKEYVVNAIVMRSGYRAGGVTSAEITWIAAMPTVDNAESTTRGLFTTCVTHKGLGGLSTPGRGGGSDTALWLHPPPKKGSLDGPPKLLPRLTPGPGGDPDPKFGKK